MTNRAPGTIWSVGPTPEGVQAYVRTVEGDHILIAAYMERYNVWQYVETDRHTARMIARRINECLDATVKR